MQEPVTNQEAALLSEGLVSVPEAAAFLGLSRSKVYVLMDTGHLIYVKLGKSRRVPKRALIELALTNMRGGWNLGS